METNLNTWSTHFWIKSTYVCCVWCSFAVLFYLCKKKPPPLHTHPIRSSRWLHKGDNMTFFILYLNDFVPSMLVSEVIRSFLLQNWKVHSKHSKEIMHQTNMHKMIFNFIPFSVPFWKNSFYQLNENRLIAHFTSSLYSHILHRNCWNFLKKSDNN